MRYHLAYLGMLFAPFLIALNFVFIGFLGIFAYVKIKINLPFFLFIAFIIYDYMILLLLNLHIKFEFIIFQGFMLLMVGIYFIYFGLYREKYLFIVVAFFILSSIQGVMAGSSIVNVINFLKAMFVFPILLILQLKFKWTLDYRHTGFIIFVFLASLGLDTVQSLYGFKKFFIDFGYDLVYHQRGISQLGEIPIGTYTSDGISNEQKRRVFGIFLSADKFAYLIYVLNILVFVIIFNKFKLKLFTFIIFSLGTMFFLYSTGVKAVLLNYTVFLYSVFLFIFCKFEKFNFRLIFILLSLFVSAFVIINLVAIDLTTSGAIGHIRGLTQPIINMFSSIELLFLGGGVGTAKSAIPLIGDVVAKYDAGNESFLGLLAYQTGASGIFLLVFLIKKVDAKFLNDLQYYLVSSIILGVYASSLFSEAVLSFFQVSCYLLSVQIVLSFKKITSSRKR